MRRSAESDQKRGKIVVVSNASGTDRFPGGDAQRFDRPRPIAGPWRLEHSLARSTASQNFNFSAIRALAMNQREPDGFQSKRAKGFSPPPVRERPAHLAPVNAKLVRERELAADCWLTKRLT